MVDSEILYLFHWVVNELFHPLANKKLLENAAAPTPLGDI
jgi:hypothetical protein